MRVAVLVPAAGVGTRMGGPLRKAGLMLAGKPLLAHVLASFQDAPGVTEVIPIVARQDASWCLEEIVTRYDFTKVKRVAMGGRERQDSVYNGLLQVDPATHVVMVHDGVRPLVTPRLIQETLKALKDWDGVVLGVPVKDTVKEVDRQGRVTQTLQRSRFRAVQTPQAFSRKILMEAHEAAIRERISRTDDAALVERLGRRVRVIPGTYENLKVTTPVDLILAEAILQSRRQPRTPSRRG